MNILEVALSQIGEKEIKGKSHNPVIVNYSKELGLPFSDDETPWCSIFINWCALKSNTERSGKANARSWLNVGIPVSEPSIGDIVVFKRGDNDWQGHVGVFIRFKGELVYVLSGNQGDEVNISAYYRSDVLGYRKLKKI